MAVLHLHYSIQILAFILSPSDKCVDRHSLIVSFVVMSHQLNIDVENTRNKSQQYL